MEHSIALVTGTTSGLGYAAAGLLAAKGYRQVIVTGRRMAQVQQTAAQLAAETKKTMLHAAGAGSGLAVQRSVRRLPSSSNEVSRSISCCSMPGWSPLKSARSRRRASKLLRRRSSAIIN